MKIINMQDYLKEKSVDNMKEGIQNLPIDDSVKEVLCLMIEVIFASVHAMEVMSDNLKMNTDAITQIANTLKEHADLLKGDIPEYVKNANNIFKSHTELIESMQRIVTTLVTDVGGLKTKFHQLENPLK